MTEAHDVQNRLKGLGAFVCGYHEHSQASVLPSPNFSFLKDLNCAKNKNPCFFGDPIANMSHEAKVKKVIGLDQDWNESLEALICLEICRNMIESTEHVKLESIGNNRFLKD